MSTNRESKPVQVGETVHVLGSGLTISIGGEGITGAARVLQRGEQFVLSTNIVEASRDRNGKIGWPSIVHDEAAQVRLWGRRMLAPGAVPLNSFEPWEQVGDETWTRERAAARRRAWDLPTHEERKAAFAEVERRFGPAPTTSSTLNAAPTPEPEPSGSASR